MATSGHRLTKAERRATVETMYPLADLEAAYLAHHRALGHSPSTSQRYAETFKLLHRFLEGVRPDSRQLSTEVMRRFAVWLRETPTKGQRGKTQRSEVSVHGHLKDCRAFLRWLADEGLLPAPVKVPLPKLPQRLFPVLSEADVAKVWNSSFLKGPGALCVRNRAMIGLMLDTGLRRAEVASLTCASLNLDNYGLTVVGKGNKERWVPFSHNVKLLLQDWLAKRGADDDEPLFWLQSAGIRTTFRRIEAETGLTKFYPHQVRHTAATVMARNGIGEFRLQAILGHADLETTRRYVTITHDDLRARHAETSPFDALVKGQQTAETPPKRRRLSRAS